MFIPWLKIDREHSFLGYKFIPIQRDKLPDGLGVGDIGVSLKALFSRYVDHMGKPSDDHAVILRDGADPFWAIAESDLEDAFLAANMFGFASLCEREFFGHDAHRINSTAFRSVAQKLSPPSTALTITRHSIDGGIMDGGYEFEDMLQQMPTQRAYSRFSQPDERLFRALEKCRAENGDLWAKICNAISIWMMANSEDQTLSGGADLTLSAIAFEHLLGGQSAKVVADNFVKYWENHLLISAAKSVKLRKFGIQTDRNRDTLGHFWMVRLYQFRSAYVHNHRRADTWTPRQLMVLQAFAFGSTVKIMLAQSGLFTINESDEDTLFAFEELLEHWDFEAEHWDAPADSDPNAKYDRKRWSTILSNVKSKRSFRRFFDRAIEEHAATIEVSSD